MLIRFAAGTKNQGAWGEDLVQALNGIGLHITSLKRRMDVDLSHGSLASTLDDDLVEGSRLYDAVDDWGRAFVVSALDSQARTAGYVKQLWQWVRFTGVAMRRDRSPREATQHHMAMILGLRNAGLPTPKVYGVADTGETSILVLHGDDIMHECNLNTLSDKDAIALLRFLSVANKRGYTHRRITPDTLARLESGTPIIAGWQNGDDASAAPNIALDQVQLLLLLAVLIGPERAVTAGRDVLGDDTMISLTPFIQKAAVPAGTRALPGWNKHIVDDMRAEMRALAPQETAEAMEPVSLQPALLHRHGAADRRRRGDLHPTEARRGHLRGEERQPGDGDRLPGLRTHRPARLRAGARGLHRTRQAQPARHLHVTGRARIRDGVHARRRRTRIREPTVPAQKRLPQYDRHRDHERRHGRVLWRHSAHAVRHRHIHRQRRA
jgi:hypothetical protein